MQNETENGNLIEALLTYAAKNLTSEQASELTNLIQANTDPRAAVAQDDPPPFEGSPSTSMFRTRHGYDPANVEKGLAFLKSRGISEDDINTLRGFYGYTIDPKVRAMDAAVRKSNLLARDAASYSRHFPEASHIKHG